MARQPRTSKSGYREKHKVKCSSCGIETNHPMLRKIKGITKWVCALCDNRLAARNGA